MEKGIENSPGHRQRLGIRVGRWAQSENPETDAVDALRIVGDDVRELTAAVLLLKLSKRRVKLLALPARNVKKAALLFKCLGVQGLVQDTSSLLTLLVA